MKAGDNYLVTCACKNITQFAFKNPGGFGYYVLNCHCNMIALNYRGIFFPAF